MGVFWKSLGRTGQTNLRISKRPSSSSFHPTNSEITRTRKGLVDPARYMRGTCHLFLRLSNVPSTTSRLHFSTVSAAANTAFALKLRTTAASRNFHSSAMAPVPTDSTSTAALRANGVHSKEKVAIIGSGNWGSAIARIAGMNVKRLSGQFEPEVTMWVKEEEVDGRPLTEIINEKHENVKYLAGINIGGNVRAEPDLKKALKGATGIVVVLPHQFLNSVLEEMKGHVEEGARAVTLIKGVDVHDGKISTFASLISKELGISCSALSGANIANEVAADKYSESTLGVPSSEAHNGNVDDHPEAKLWKPLFETPTFRIQVVEDVDGVSLCGALKNVVAMAAGFVDGLGWGDNSKAAIMRIGMLEIHDFCLEFFPGTKSTTFLVESCGVADIMTSCMGGRNRRVAMEMVKTKKSFQELEKELLNGQKLQGALTALEVHQFLDAQGVGNIKRKNKYPLFENVWNICFNGIAPEKITENL